MPTFLVKAAEARVMLFERREGVQGVGNPAQEALRDGGQQQRIALIVHTDDQCLSGSEGIGELILPHQSAYRGQFGVDRIHGDLRKKRADRLRSTLDFTATHRRRL
jgi:hypothetical protein